MSGKGVVLFLAILPAIMSDLHPSPDNTAQAASSGFLFHDWDPSEKGMTAETPQFDGKIIARMPDLGSESLNQNIERTKLSAFWHKLGTSIASLIEGTPTTRQQLLRHCTIVGGVVLLCGIGFLLLEQKSEPTASVLDTTGNVLTNTETPRYESIAIVGDSGKFAPIMQSEGLISISTPTIPDAPIDRNATMPNTTIPNATIPPPPAVDPTYSPWNVTTRQPENPIPESVSQSVTPHVPAPPPTAVAMAPMIDMSAPFPVSPHEQQLYAHPHVSSNMPPTIPPNMPVDPFAQTNFAQTNFAQTNTGVVPQQNVQRPVSPPVYPQYVPPSAVQNVYGRQGHPHPHAVPPNTPIPSGVSTLPPQGGYPPPHHPSGAPMSAPRQPNDFYYAPPSSTYRRVY